MWHLMHIIMAYKHHGFLYEGIKMETSWAFFTEGMKHYVIHGRNIGDVYSSNL